jgi:hypothetical protein
VEWLGKLQRIAFDLWHEYHETNGHVEIRQNDDIIVGFGFHWNTSELCIRLENCGLVTFFKTFTPIQKWPNEACIKKVITKFFEPVECALEEEIKAIEKEEEDEGFEMGGEETENDEP